MWGAAAHSLHHVRCADGNETGTDDACEDPVQVGGHGPRKRDGCLSCSSRMSAEPSGADGMSHGSDHAASCGRNAGVIHAGVVLRDAEEHAKVRFVPVKGPACPLLR